MKARRICFITCASSEARHKFKFAPCFFLNLCRVLQPLDVILDILDSGYIRLFDIVLDILNSGYIRLFDIVLDILNSGC